MSTVSPELEYRPVALIVEDVPTTLNSRKEIFNKRGFYAIGAQSMAEALRELRTGPAVNLVVTDIGLNQQDPLKDSGFDLLEEIRKRRGAKLPVVAYSARFEDDNDIWDNAEFDDVLRKGDAYRIDEKIPQWLGLARQYRKERITNMRGELKRLQEHYDIPDREIEILRDFLPGSHPLPVGGAAEAVEEAVTANELLRQAGYRLRIVEAQTPVPESGPPPARVATSFAVWLRHVQGAAIVELYGHPSIFSYSEVAEESARALEARLKQAEDEAVEFVLDLMYGYHQELNLQSTGPKDMTPEVAALCDFLRKVFG